MSKLVTIGLLLLSLNCFGTAQSPDFLVYKGDTLALFSNPLESLYKANPDGRPKTFFKKTFCSSTACWRGYIAYWEIIGGKIFLTNIQSCCFNSKETADLVEFFGDKAIEGKVFADWINEELFSPTGKRLQYAHMGYASVFEKEIGFLVERGELIEVKNYDNSKSKFPEYYKDGQKLNQFINSRLSRDLFKDKDNFSILAKVKTDENGKILKVTMEIGLGEPYDTEIIKVLNELDEWVVIYRHGKMIEWGQLLTFEIDKRLMKKKHL
jgi:hypothetical protein